MATVKILTDDGVPKSTIHLDRFDLNSQAKREGWQKWFLETVTNIISREDAESNAKEKPE